MKLRVRSCVVLLRRKTSELGQQCYGVDRAVPFMSVSGK